MESDIYGNTALPLAPDLQIPSKPTDVPVGVNTSLVESGKWSFIKYAH